MEMMMDELLGNLGQVFFAAFALSVGVEMLKQFPLQRWKDNEYFSGGIWAVTFIGAFLITWLFQGMGWITDGWRVTVVAGLFVGGLAMMGYEGVKILWLRVRGDNVGGDSINVNTVSGNSVSIGRDSESKGGG